MSLFEELFSLPKGLDDDAEFMPLFSVEEHEDNIPAESVPSVLPVLALKNTVLFPGIVIPITVGRDKSLKAINTAYKKDNFIAVLSQKDTSLENPGADDLYQIGTIAKIIKLLKMPDGTATAILRGKQRFRLAEMVKDTPYLEGRVELLDYTPSENKLEYEAMISTIKDMSRQIIELSPNIPSEAVVMLDNIKNPTFLLNFISSNLGIKVPAKQIILEISNLQEKATTILEHLDSELQILELKDEIESKVRTDIEKQQKEYYLNQQLKTIQEELGQNPHQDEIQKLAERAKKMTWLKDVGQAFQKELNKIKRINPQVAEFSVTMNYMELLLDLPWGVYTKDNFNLVKVKKVLDKDHFGLEKVKERILEHLAVLKLKGDMKAPILCLVGPPGVGKTSLGRSIANALKRKFIRMSLGGLHDESEIRGHRKTYIGAMPGRIIKSIKKAGSSNPVFILDEIDKVGKDFRGDPSSALLEVLDPEQNESFYDNYLDLEYDLSKVLFIATANSLNTIQPALLDRMEIIQIGGYSTEEKIEIAKQHLIPEQREEHGLKASQIKLKKETLNHIIENYTRESGVRGLNRNIAGVMRNVAKKVAMEEEYNITVDSKEINSILGPTKFSKDIYTEVHAPGVAVGLAWTRVGGDILFIETSLSKGKGKLILTGNLGEVMKESATTALSYIKAHNKSIGISDEKFDSYDVHVHVPEGAIPKDGPSAGVTMITSIASAFKEKSVRPFLAMTGEITLRGKVLPVGGIKEKILAAKRAGIKVIMLCAENEKHIDEINQTYLKGMSFHYVHKMEDVLKYALGKS